MTKTVVLKPRPFETSPDADILYSSVTVDGSRRRAIVTHPKTTGRSPAVPLIGGLGCYSLDGEIAKQTGYGPILAALAKNNFVTMRVEKTGEGDSEGPACTDTNATAELEARGYVAGLQALKGYAFVDPSRVLIFAHSLGPLLGSMVVTQEARFSDASPRNPRSTVRCPSASLYHDQARTIKAVQISKPNGWFDDVSISLNQGLVSIVGQVCGGLT
jgi:hypothetical protein